MTTAHPTDRSALVIGCGYLGLRVARLWLAAGVRVSALTRSRERAKELARLGVEPIVGDVTCRDSLGELSAAGCFDTVLHAVGYDRRSSAPRRSVLVDGLRNALSAVQPRCSRLIYVSSIGVYGQTDGSWVDEDSPCEPARENGRLCLEGEQTLWSELHDRRPQTAACVLRLAGIYGPGRLLRRAESLRAGEPIPGSPAAWLNLIHVDDAATAVLAAENRGEAGRTYLICDNRPVTRADYFAELAARLNAPPPQFNESLAATRTAGLNKRCRNARMIRELKVALKYPDAASLETGDEFLQRYC